MSVCQYVFHGTGFICGATARASVMGKSYCLHHAEVMAKKHSVPAFPRPNENAAQHRVYPTAAGVSAPGDNSESGGG